LNKVLITLLMVLICSPAFSATQLKKTVCPSGCDYTSLEAAMNGNEQNLVAADKYFDVEISGTWSSADTTAVTIHNYTTDATRYINIYTTGSARHQGVYSASYYRSEATSNNISVMTSYTTVDGLQVYQTSPGNSTSNIVDGSRYSVGNIFKNNIVKGANGRAQNGISVAQDSGSFGPNGAKVYNNIIYNFKNTTYNNGTGISAASGNPTAYLYNNTVYLCYTGIQGFSSASYPVTLKNNIAYNNVTDYNTTSWGSTSTNNLSKDATAPALNTYYRNKTLTFTNNTAGYEDFHLVAGDTDAIDKGADLGSPYNVDIDGTTRSGTWDIGADEYVSASTPLGSTFNDWYTNDQYYLPQ
jgi:hypothetical protein